MNFAQASQRLTPDGIKDSLHTTGQLFIAHIENESHPFWSSEKAKPWIRVHELLASLWGYYGDLDLHGKDYIRSLFEMTAKGHQSIMSEIAKAEDHHLYMIQQTEQMKAEGWEIIS